jgi:hypothetical protein
MEKEMSNVKQVLYEALERKYISDKADAIAMLELSFNNGVALGDHLTLLTDMDTLVCRLAQAEENIVALRNNFSDSISILVDDDIELSEVDEPKIKVYDIL